MAKKYSKPASKVDQPKHKDEPKRKPDIRTRHCAFFLTEEDARRLSEFALQAGFSNRGQLVTAIMERLLIGGFSPLVFAKTGLQLRKYAAKNMIAPSLPELFQQESFYFGVRPLPAMPDQHISEQELKREVKALGVALLKPSQA